MIIAEIGMNHLGSVEKAKELIRAAVYSGADIVKGQAFLAKDVAKTGSMDYEFYRQCELTFDEYIELIDYSRSLGSDFFYSIFSNAFEPIVYHQWWHKIAGIQVKNQYYKLKYKDTPRTIVSVPENSICPQLRHATILHVSPYMATNPNLEQINHLTMIYKRPIGYSDHTVGTEWCLKAIKEYNVPVIEKHFHVGEEIKFNGKVFRDTVHSAGPKELEEIRNTFEKEFI